MERPPALVSHRGFLLVLEQDPKSSTLTVELYIKWYNLFLVRPVTAPGMSRILGHAIDRIEFDELEAHTPEGQSAYNDNTPNPVAVRNLAEHKNWVLPECALELILGRWIYDRGMFPEITGQ